MGYRFHIKCELESDLEDPYFTGDPYSAEDLRSYQITIRLTPELLKYTAENMLEDLLLQDISKPLKKIIAKVRNDAINKGLPDKEV